MLLTGAGLSENENYMFVRIAKQQVMQYFWHGIFLLGDLSMPDRTDNPIDPGIPQSEPDMATCHASSSGMADLYYCQSSNRYCSYRMTFGSMRLCLHPGKELIARNSQRKPATEVISQRLL